MKSERRAPLTLIVLLLFSLAASAQDMAFSLVLPDSWFMEAIEAPFFATRQAWGLSWPGWEKVFRSNEADFFIGPHAITASVYPGSLQASGQQYGWGQENGQWWLEGRERTPAVFRRGSDFDFLSGAAATGIRTKPGNVEPASSIAPAFVTVIDNRKGSLVVLVADPFFEDRALFDRIAASIRQNIDK